MMSSDSDAGRGRDNVTATEADVERKLLATWPVPADQAVARALLLTYGTASGEQEQERVRLALIKLSGGDLNELATLAVAATRDYRDVLMWAEFPEEARAPFAHRLDLTAPERSQLKAIRARDRSQYEAWRKQ